MSALDVCVLRPVGVQDVVAAALKSSQLALD